MNIYGIKSYIKVEYKVFDSITCKELDLSVCNTKNIFTEIYMDRFYVLDTIIQKGEEGGIVYKEANTIFEYEIVDGNTIKLVNIYGENSNTDDYARKIGRIFTLSN